MYRNPGGLVASPDRMYGNPARFALAHDRLFASTAHCSRRLPTGEAVPCTSNSIPTTPHPVPLTCYSVPPTSHFISTMSIILPLEGRPPRPIEAFSRRPECVAASQRHPTRPPRRRARWPLAFGASPNEVERAYEISTERRTGCAEAVRVFLDDNAAVLAAIVNLTAARRRLGAGAASFTGHLYDQDPSDRDTKG